MPKQAPPSPFNVSHLIFFDIMSDIPLTCKTLRSQTDFDFSGNAVNTRFQRPYSFSKENL